MREAPAPHAVHKFGGAALGDAPAIQRVVALLAECAPGGRVVVTSALSGVTDALLAAATLAALGDAHQAADDARRLRERHHDVASALLEGDVLDAARAAIDASYDALDALLTGVSEARRIDARVTDLVLSRGERLAAMLVCGALAGTGVRAHVMDATRVLHTDGRFGDAAPDLARTAAAAHALLLPALQRGETVVVPGFLGAGADGSADDVVTLGRGGSDLTATVLARAVGAAEVTLWKDVPGFLTADPRLVPDARVVAQLDPREASELAYYGAKVLHPRALTPLEGATVLRIRPFADSTAPGTQIVRGRTTACSPVRALSAIMHQALITVAGNGMLGVPGIAARTFGAMARAGISVSLISQASSEHSICFTVPETRAADAEAGLREEFAVELARGEIDEVEVEPALATLAVVGTGMARTPGIAARVFTAAAAARVNVVAIAQGSSERNISLVVEGAQVPLAVRAIHAAFRLSKVGGGRVDRPHGADVVLLGMGRIGRELVDQIVKLPPRERAALRIVAVLDRAGFVFDGRGLSTRRLAALASHKQRGGSLADAAGGRTGDPLAAVEHIAAHALTRPVLVDLASGDTRAALLAAVSHGMDLVLANKVPLASDGHSARALLGEARSKGRRVMHEATVGAGLPIIDTVDKLIASGDRVLSIIGCPSGTMGYLFGELGRGRRFSDALRGAMAAGYTEPDPREDLSGMDVARKGLILGRLIGYAGELTDVAVESLVPESLRDAPLSEFLDQLETLDAAWAERVEAARARGEVLRYRAHATRGGVKVGLAGVPLGSSFAALDGTDNQFVFTTVRYRENPLVITGPGAGPTVTAAGVLNDLMRVTGA
jgi:aspartokinase/homoserine dehydrogenase 1